MVSGDVVRREQPVRIADIRLGEEAIEAVTDVLRSGALREGPWCTRFEGEFAAAVDAGAATTLSNGTAALHAALMGTVGPGDEVLVPAVSFFATAAMVAWTGATPVFCDIDEKTFCLDMEDARQRITPRTRAIVPVHLFGNTPDVDAVLALAETHKLAIVWDAAQAHLSRWKQRGIGGLPGLTCYSFYATKNLTTGEGGMVTADREELLEPIRLLKRQGQAAKYQHTVLGTNYRMTDMQAAIGSTQLQMLPEQTQNRRQNADRYRQLLSRIDGLQLPFVDERTDHSYHQFTLVVDPSTLGCSRDDLVGALKEMNIQVGINYPIPLHQQPVFTEDTVAPTLPIAESFCQNCLSLPVQPYLQADEIDYVAAVMRGQVGADS